MAKEKQENKYKDGQSSAFLNFFMEIVNYIALVVSVILTFSLSLLLDMLSSSCNLTRTGICFFLNKKLQKNLKFSYNYGAERLEVLVSTFCDILMVLSSLFILGFAVYQIVMPREVSELIIVAVVFKVICVLADIGILVPSYKAYRKTKTQMSKTVFEGMVSSTAFDSGILLAVLLSMLLKSWAFVGYVEPVLSIIIALFVIIRAFKRIKNEINELTDLTLDEDSQMKILKIINTHYNDYDNLNAISSHRLGNKVLIDLDLRFAKQTTYEELQTLITEIEAELSKDFPELDVSLHITNN